MTSPRAVLATVVVVGALGLGLAFLSSTGRLPPPLAVGVAVAPALAGAVAVAWRTSLRWPTAGVALALLVAAALHAGELSRHIRMLWFLQHAAGHALLALVFGRTLLPGAEPLATRVARAVLPSMPPAVVGYTRGVTVAWTVYFVVMTVVSVALYVGASAATWSMFATLVSGPLVALMFGAEFALRRYLVPASHRASIAQTVAGFRALTRTPAPCAIPPTRQPHA